VTFPWLDPTPPAGGAGAHLAAQLREVRERAGLLFRLGYSAEAASRRIAARIAWEYDPASRTGSHRRPEGLSDAAIAEAVRATYARRPSGAL
jgi:hypothetical protein